MEHYAGLDVSLELTSVCIVDAQGGIVGEVKRQCTMLEGLDLSINRAPVAGVSAPELADAVREAGAMNYFFASTVRKRVCVMSGCVAGSQA